MKTIDNKETDDAKEIVSPSAGEISFADGKWNPEDWLLVRSPRWQERSRWIQDSGNIANYVPDDLAPEEMQMGRDRTGETYISMLYKKPFCGNTRFETRCCFDDRMAPLLVFSQELTPVHHDHLEVVLYDCGVNLWHHYYRDGKPSWKLLGFLDRNLKRGEMYDLSARFIFNTKGVFLQMACAGQTFGCRIDGAWPNAYYAGITGCEGKNRFFHFRFDAEYPLTNAEAERFTD